MNEASRRAFNGFYPSVSGMEAVKTAYANTSGTLTAKWDDLAWDVEHRVFLIVMNSRRR